MQKFLLQLSTTLTIQPLKILEGRAIRSILYTLLDTSKYFVGLHYHYRKCEDFLCTIKCSVYVIQRKGRFLWDSPQFN